MTSVLKEILDSFYADLAKSQEIDDVTIKAIRELLESGEKLKADDIVDVLSAEANGPAA